jgi:cytochrome c peroxidase
MRRMTDTARSTTLASGLLALAIFGAIRLNGIEPSRPLLASSDAAPQGQMPPDFEQEIARVAAETDQIEDRALRLMSQTTRDPEGQIRTLGKLLLFDKHLSVNENEACGFCHSADTGFTGGIQSLNLTAVSYPGSVRTRFSNRKAPSYMYAAFAPVLHYKSLQGEFVGGNFWDMRASGYRLQSPSAEQAQGPPTNPVELGLPDSACLAYRLSKAPYRKLFEQVWGADSFAIAWPADAERVCSTPGPPSDSDLFPVHLSTADRQRTNQVYDGFGLAVAAYEASPEVSPFASKYDFVQSGKGAFTAEEARGYALFRGKARCNECHSDDVPGKEPLFTDYTASDLGVPRNPALQFYFQAAPDKSGYSPNPKGASYTDTGVGYFLNKLKSLSGQLNPNSQWVGLAPEFDGKFQVPTLRDVDMRPNPQFVKAYMHNGYFKSLKEVVHFCNTRDVLPTCKPGDPGEKISCWPPPEYPTNINKTQLGDLKLTDQEENDLVAFLKTLTDEYSGNFQWIWGNNGKTSSPMPSRWMKRARQETPEEIASTDATFSSASPTQGSQSLTTLGAEQTAHFLGFDPLLRRFSGTPIAYFKPGSCASVRSVVYGQCTSRTLEEK